MNQVIEKRLSEILAFLKLSDIEYPDDFVGYLWNILTLTYYAGKDEAKSNFKVSEDLEDEKTLKTNSEGFCSVKDYEEAQM